jgi:hypothetical protein
MLGTDKTGIACCHGHGASDIRPPKVLFCILRVCWGRPPNAPVLFLTLLVIIGDIPGPHIKYRFRKPMPTAVRFAVPTVQTSAPGGQGTDKPPPHPDSQTSKTELTPRTPQQHSSHAAPASALKARHPFGTPQAGGPVRLSGTQTTTEV